MKLDDFLKCKKVKCVQAFGFHSTLTAGKVYDVKGLSERHVHICNDANNVIGYEFSLFEPVTDLPKSAENPLQNIELTPEFGAVEPKFKVGDKVYFGVNPKIQTIESVHAYNNIKFIGTWGCAHAKQCCRATPENHERLQATFPHIEFEQPPRELTGSDLARAMLDKGWKYVPCYVSEDSDVDAIDHCYTDIIVYQDKSSTRYFRNENNGQGWDYAVPLDPRTGEPLTESILND